jgi:2-polyprenyl-6-methoxyphenol hydroxylase-like FAD-dependent oxidoreductase
MDDFDVVVVGGGIAGASAARALAQRGTSALVLESTEVHDDRVRGEGMSPWGVTEAERLGVDDVMLSAGGSLATEVAAYDEAWHADSVEPTDLSLLGLRGFLHVGHPEACEALCSAAERAGAVVARGVDVKRVATGATPAVVYTDGEGVEREVRARVVLGADGRASFVRRHLGFELRESEALTFGGGMLVTDHRWPEQRLGLGTDGDFHYIITPRAGAVRLYLFASPAVGRELFRGKAKSEKFLAAYRLRSLPDPAAFSAASPAGPCAGFPMNDSWVDDPTADGVVLVGDAAGWSNPIIGQGLAVAMRDVRQVVDIVASGVASRSDFAPYVTERRERMRRLRATAFVDTCVLSRFDDIGRSTREEWRERIAGDAEAAAHVFGKAIGVDDFPAEAYDVETVRRLVGRDHPYLHALDSHGLDSHGVDAVPS